MKTKDSKIIYIITIAILAVVCFSIVLTLILNNVSDNVYITLYSPLNGSKKVVKLNKGSMIGDKLTPIEIEGYEFIGWFYNYDLTLKVEETDIFNSSAILKAGYSRIIKKTSNSLVNEITSTTSNKYITLITDENNYLTQEELENILSYNPIYLNLSNSSFESNILSKNTFYNQTSLNTLYIPNNITVIDEYCFKNCYDLENINISNIERIEEGVFYNCKNLKRFISDDTLKFIGKYAFEGCELEYLYLGKNINNISSESFYNTVIENFDIDEENTSYILKDGVIYTRDYKSLIYVTNQLIGRLNVNVLTQNIEPYACYNNKNITSVVLNDNITNIDNGAFKNCANLEEILFMIQTNYKVSDSAFENCLKLKEVRFSVGLSEIGNNAFKDCKSLSNVIFNLSTESGINNIGKIGNSAFKNCRKLKEIIIPDSVYDVGTELFYGCISLKTVTLSSKVSAITDKMFYDNIALESINCNGKIEIIGDYSFANCTNLKNITTLFDASSLGYGAFRNCESLTSINFNNLTTINSECFYNCKNLTSTSFDRVETINEKSFALCSSLQSFYISSNLSNISYDAFDNCSSLTEFIGVSNSNFIIEDGVIYDNQKNAIICYPEGKNDINFTILNSITNIYGLGLYKNKYLKNLNVEGLNTVFSSVDGVLYSKDKSILYRYPAGKEVTNVSILSTVSQINQYAFAFNENIEVLTFPNSIESFGENCLVGLVNLQTLCVPFVGKDYENSRYLGYLFGAYNSSLNYEYIPSSLTSVLVTNDTEVPDYAFYDCNNIKYIEFYDSVSSVGKYAFYNTSSLEEIYFYGNIKSIDEYAFYNLSSFKTLTFGFDSELLLEENSFGNLSLVIGVRVHNNGQNLAQAYKTQLLSKFYSVYSRASRWSWSFI